MPYRIEPFEQPRVRFCRRRERQFPHGLRDRLVGPGLPEFPHLFVNPGIYEGQVGLGCVDRDQVLPENVQRAQFAETPHAMRHQTGVVGIAIELQQCLNSSHVRAQGMDHLRRRVLVEQSGHQLQHGGLIGEGCLIQLLSTGCSSGMNGRIRALHLLSFCQDAECVRRRRARYP